MTQYVLQVIISGKEEDLGWLIKSFTVTLKFPIPSYVAPEKQQLVTEDITMYDGAVAFYEEHGKDAFYIIDGDIITWALREK